MDIEWNDKGVWEECTVWVAKCTQANNVHKEDV